MPRRRLSRILSTGAAALLLASVVVGCSTDGGVSVDGARDAGSRVRACAELIRTSASQVDDVARHLDSPREAADAVRSAAEQVRAKAAEINDAEVQRAVDRYQADLEKLARRAEQGRMPDADDVRRAAARLTDACR